MIKDLPVYSCGSPAVSIILPTFNRRSCLWKAMDSVLLQEFLDWELIVVDDGSSDNSLGLIGDYLGRDSRIRIIAHSNRGVSRARNVGIRVAEGRFVAFLDSDDHYLPAHLRLRFAYMEANPHLDLVHGGFRVLGDPYVVCRHNAARVVHLDSCFVGGTIFCKRRILLALGGFRGLNYSEDGDLIERAGKFFKVRRVDFPTYVYDRTREDSITNQRWLRVASRRALSRSTP